jgi:hypothetical protein
MTKVKRKKTKLKISSSSDIIHQGWARCQPLSSSGLQTNFEWTTNTWYNSNIFCEISGSHGGEYEV